ncbi:MAG: HD domain-containing protein [Bacteroidetes bacterium]|nr:HD domain-containing protein [Bacteroidota bacterium]MBU1374165.1 HD domain-containing protein [Bacteroidota bacterium]MBU1484722.1 HD domain-containing protein [Bacteroidota bacterium]MBU1761531.1 HD domain-containing protein [Bacteroidota bacterium]MBU2267295.1 HD domain-containing protein [Bacteroidota bacterium]
MNKNKIINDPVYGFISIKTPLLFDLIEHPYFQRLRYIKQLGMTHLVYPGALHTRFHHALGAMHLMQLAIEHLQSKGHEITKDEEEAACVAILLHDIGHGPFSHALEHTIVEGVSHEKISRLFMANLNEEFDGQLDLALQIFNNQHPKKFLYQLISGQLDLDRLDYLNRDSFFSGVTEGMVSSDRIIKLINIKEDELVVEEKGIYSIEKFLIARRLMYWQVYLHKTVIAAEQLLVKILIRARELASNGVELFATPALKHFLYKDINETAFSLDPTHLQFFSMLDDHDIMSSIKVWQLHDDFILKTLCANLNYRNLYKVEISVEIPNKEKVDELSKKVIEKLGIDEDDSAYFVFTDTINNMAYKTGNGSINILMKDGSLKDIATASDNSNLEALSKTVTKNILCYTKV